MAVVSLIGAVQAIFYLIVFQSKSKKTLSDYVLMLFTLLIGAIFFDQYLRNTDFYQLHPEYWGITYCFPILTAPLLYIYVELITGPVQRFRSWFWLLMLPFFFFLTYYLITYYFLPIEKKIAYFRLATTKPWAMIYAGEFSLVFSGTVYSVLGLFRLKKHIQNIGLNFSYTEGINLNWLKSIFIAIVIVNLLGLLSNVVTDVFPLFPYQTGDNFISAINVTLVFIIGYFGMKQALIYPTVTAKPELIDIEQNSETINTQNTENFQTSVKYLKSGLQDNLANEYYSSLIQLIESEKLFIDSKLSIKTVADRLGVKVNHLSQVINQKTGKNFFKFINEYRVEEAKRLLSSPANQKFTILAIAYDCGFNSKSSFNTIFKEYTGQTPSDFIKKSSI